MTVLTRALDALLQGARERRAGWRPRATAAGHRHDTARHRARRYRRYPACRTTRGW